MSFECHPFEKYAIRPFFGGVNGISGEQTIIDQASRFPKSSMSKVTQDYIVVPEQKRLDGIATSPGVVKQCVATQMTMMGKGMTVASANIDFESGGSNGEQHSQTTRAKGQTIEWQMTGKDRIRGLQLQIIPRFKVERIFAGSTRDVCPDDDDENLRSYERVPHTAAQYDVLSTPEELGLSDGDIIHIKDMGLKERQSRSKLVRDLLRERPLTQAQSSTITLEACPLPSTWKIFTVRAPGSTDETISFEVGMNRVHALSSANSPKVDFFDEFDTILEAARKALNVPDGFLHMESLVANNPHICLPVTSWGRFTFFTDYARKSGGDIPLTDFILVGTI